MECLKNKQFNYWPLVREGRVAHVVMDSEEIYLFSTINTLIQAVCISKNNDNCLKT